MPSPPSPFDDRLQRIKTHLTGLHQRWKRASGWYGDVTKPDAIMTEIGAMSHHFDPPDPLWESELREFEEAHSIQLPPDFRAFLRVVGDGGAGPRGGLRNIYHGPPTLDDDKRWLGFECPLRDDLPDDDPDWISAIGGIDAFARMDEGTWHPYQGCISLTEMCGGYMEVIILSGPEQGRVCGVSLACDDPPLFSPYPSFLTWYEAWLESVLRLDP